MTSTRQLVLIRHGESEWNRENRFTGWADIPLTERGTSQMRELGELLCKARLIPDITYTSRSRRSCVSNEVLLESMGRRDVLTSIDWRLNERHYGKLTGLSKHEATKTFGAAAVQRWRRSFDAAPPLLDLAQSQTLLGDAYDDLPFDFIPKGESLAQVVTRVRACWDEKLLPELRAGKRVLVTAHGNSLRALVKVIEGISNQDIASLEIANARALIYDLNADGNMVSVGSIGSAVLTPSHIL